MFSIIGRNLNHVSRIKVFLLNKSANVDFHNWTHCPKFNWRLTKWTPGVLRGELELVVEPGVDFMDPFRP
jgi:hypothetical protein